MADGRLAGADVSSDRAVSAGDESGSPHDGQVCELAFEYVDKRIDNYTNLTPVAASRSSCARR